MFTECLLQENDLALVGSNDHEALPNGVELAQVYKVGEGNTRRVFIAGECDLPVDGSYRYNVGRETFEPVRGVNPSPWVAMFDLCESLEAAGHELPVYTKAWVEHARTRVDDWNKGEIVR